MISISSLLLSEEEEVVVVVRWYEVWKKVDKSNEKKEVIGKVVWRQSKKVVNIDTKHGNFQKNIT